MKGEKIMMRTELTPRYLKQKSFYKKAHILSENDVYMLESYTTIVMKYNKTTRVLEICGDYSVTTRRHQWEFMCWLEDTFNGEYFTNVYHFICGAEKMKSFAKFLREVSEIDLVNHTYKLSQSGEVKKFI